MKVVILWTIGGTVVVVVIVAVAGIAIVIARGGFDIVQIKHATIASDWKRDYRLLMIHGIVVRDVVVVVCCLLYNNVCGREIAVL